MNRNVKTVLWIVWGALLLWGAVGVYQRFAHGHAHASYGSYVPWGLHVSAYIYFIGLSAGAFLLSSLIYVFGVKRLESIGPLSLLVAAVTLPIALLCIWFDLGHMWRFHEVFTRPNWTSMMAWMVWLYTAYFVLIAVELGLVLRGGSDRTLRVLGAIGVPLAIAFHGGVGALFATLAAKPLWHSSLYPILFLTGAIVSGGGLLLAVFALVDRGDAAKRQELLRLLGRIVLGLLLFDLLLEWAELSVPMWYAVGSESTSLRGMLFGEFWWVFWIFHILLGSLIPIVLLLARPQSRTAVFAAGGLIATTFLAVRLNVVIPAQLTPAMKGIEEAYRDARLSFSYVPSLYEWSVMAFVVALGVGLLFLGNRLLAAKRAQPQAN